MPYVSSGREWSNPFWAFSSSGSAFGEDVVARFFVGEGRTGDVALRLTAGIVDLLLLCRMLRVLILLVERLLKPAIVVRRDSIRLEDDWVFNAREEIEGDAKRDVPDVITQSSRSLRRNTRVRVVVVRPLTIDVWTSSNNDTSTSIARYRTTWLEAFK